MGGPRPARRRGFAAAAAGRGWAGYDLVGPVERATVAPPAAPSGGRFVRVLRWVQPYDEKAVAGVEQRLDEVAELVGRWGAPAHERFAAAYAAVESIGAGRRWLPTVVDRYEKVLAAGGEASTVDELRDLLAEVEPTQLAALGATVAAIDEIDERLRQHEEPSRNYGPLDWRTYSEAQQRQRQATAALARCRRVTDIGREAGPALRAAATLVDRLPPVAPDRRRGAWPEEAVLPAELGGLSVSLPTFPALRELREVDVVNVSWSVATDPRDHEVAVTNRLLRDEIRTVLARDWEPILVFPTGNRRAQEPLRRMALPARCAGVVAVGSLAGGRRAADSRYGGKDDELWWTAPGGGHDERGVAVGALVEIGGRPRVGTSFATAFASGLIALAVAGAGGSGRAAVLAGLGAATIDPGDEHGRGRLVLS